MCHTTLVEGIRQIHGGHFRFKSLSREVPEFEEKYLSEPTEHESGKTM